MICATARPEFKELRPYFYEDYYPLSGINNITSENIWLAYQLYRPSDDSGYIVAFRRKDNPDKSYTVNLSGLHPDHTYILTNKDTGEAIKKTGKELANGFTLTLDNPQSSLIIKYQSSTTAIQNFCRKENRCKAPCYRCRTRSPLSLTKCDPQ